MLKYKLIFIFSVLVVILLSEGPAFSHSPHDVIFDIALSPVFSEDHTAFLIASNTLMISRDEGNSWKKLANGLDNSSQLISISVSPAFDRDGTVWVTSEGDGIYRSENGGRSWENVNSGLNRLDILSVAVSPGFLNDGKAVALDDAGRLYESSDSGRTWTPIHPDFEGRITCMTFLLIEDKAILMAGTDQGEVRLSDESRRHWEQVPLPADCPEVTSLAVSPYFKKDGRIWAGTQCEIYEVNVLEKTAEPFHQGLADPHITSLLAAPGPEDRITLYASTWKDALFKTDDVERVWVKYGKGLTTDPQANDPRFIMPNFKGIAAENGMLFLGGYDGLFKSLNGGKTWEQVDTILLSGITGLDVYSEKGSDNHKVALATYGAGAYLFDSQLQEWEIINRGLHWTRLNDMVFSPNFSKDGLLFSGSENNFLVFNRKDGYWQRIPVSQSFEKRVKGRLSHYLKKIGLKTRWVHHMLPPDPGDTRFPSVIGPSPNFAEDRTLFFGTRSSGLYVSKKSGRSNRPLWDANESLITTLCLSPQFSEDGTLYAGVFGSGIFRSSDEGKSWRKTGGGDMNPSREVRLAMSPVFAEDGIMVAGHASGLFLSENRGKDWHPIGREDLGPSPNVVCMAVSPMFKEDRMILVGIQGRGIWMTQDLGKSFTPFAEALIENNYQAKFIEFSGHFHIDQTLYCASSYELLRSLDGGATWHRLPRPIRYEDLREEVRFTGNWHTLEDDRYSALSAAYTNAPGSGFRLRFTGTQVTWIGDTSPRHGKARVFLDGLPVKTVSQKSDRERRGVEIFSLKGLEARNHEFSVEIVCEPGSAECGAVSVDAIDVFMPETADEPRSLGWPVASAGGDF